MEKNYFSTLTATEELAVKIQCNECYIETKMTAEKIREQVLKLADRFEAVVSISDWDGTACVKFARVGVDLRLRHGLREIIINNFFGRISRESDLLAFIKVATDISYPEQ